MKLFAALMLFAITVVKTVVAENDRATPQDYLVQGLEQVEPAYAEFEGSMYAGLIPMDHDDRVGETMFWLFEPVTQLVDKTLVMWLNGGPGCSSFNCGGTSSS